MNKQQNFRYFSLTINVAFSLALYSSVAQSMSSTTEIDPNYYPVNWRESTLAEDDARYAAINNDLRVLGFATRGYSVPGVDARLKQKYIDKCGIRLFENSSDVVRGTAQLEQMQQAKEYAKNYNAIILENCTLDN